MMQEKLLELRKKDVFKSTVQRITRQKKNQTRSSKEDISFRRTSGQSYEYSTIKSIKSKINHNNLILTKADKGQTDYYYHQETTIPTSRK